MLEATNPILPGFHPDPSICRVGDVFYLVNSTFEYFPGLPIHRSTDLVTWELVGHAIDRAGQLDLESVAASGGLYAPTIRYDAGQFWIACTLVRGGGGGGDADDVAAGNFLISAQDPAGPWSDPVWISSSRGIDPTILFSDGDLWVAGCRPAAPAAYAGQTEIWLSRVDRGTGALLGAEHVLWTGAVRGAVWSEGPHLYRIGEWYYLLTAEGGTEQNHAVAVARSRHLTGPYEGCPRNPVFSHRTLGSTAHVQRVGHADLVQRRDGTWWAVMLGVRTVDRRHMLGRETFLAPVSFEDDWPVFNPGHGRLTRRVPVDRSIVAAGRTRAAVAIGRTRAAVAIGRGGQSGFDRDWLSLRAPATFADVGDEGLTISPSQATLRQAATPAFLGCRLADLEVEIELTLDLPAADVGSVEAGLALYQSPEFHLTCAVERTPDGWVARVHEVRGGAVAELGSSPPFAADATAATLRARLAGSTVEFEVETATGRPAAGGAAGAGPQRANHRLARASTAVLSTEVAGGFVGTVLGPYAVALAPRAAPDVRFTSFRYEPAGAERYWHE